MNQVQKQSPLPGKKRIPHPFPSPGGRGGSYVGKRQMQRPPSLSREERGDVMESQP
jgi:hypothetical protein